MAPEKEVSKMEARIQEIDDLGDGLLVSGINPADNSITISDKETRLTLGIARGETGKALQDDLRKKIAYIREQRSSVAAAVVEKKEDLSAGRKSLVDELRKKSPATQAAAPVAAATGTETPGA